MGASDLVYLIQWWLLFFAIGVVFLPLTITLFFGFFDKGYIFSKILGIGIISYTIFFLGIIRLVPFTRFSSICILLFFLFLFLLFNVSFKNGYLIIKKSFFNLIRQKYKIFMIEESLFLAALLFWAYIKSFQPDIQGLEKFMDFGFINSILRADYFPPKDMWFTPFSINYYYFGHLTTAVLTKLSGIPSYITFNLMLSAIFALTFVSSFSIAANLILFLAKDKLPLFKNIIEAKISKIIMFKVFIWSFLTAFLVTLAGNLQTIYTFFKPYEGENVVPFWKLPFLFNTFPNSYWYPNATRFIYHTIHEFPIYSWVVSDLHGHVLDIPFVLLLIAILLSVFLRFSQQTVLANHNNNSHLEIFNFKFKLLPFNFAILILLGFLLAIMYMTNAWDGVIYFLLVSLVFGYLEFLRARQKNTDHNPILKILPVNQVKWISNLLINNWLIDWIIGLFVYLFTIIIVVYLFSLPFNLNFKPFVSGIGVLCAPEFLIKIGKIGPFLFEVKHCQHSPLWQMALLYGFFYFMTISFTAFLFKTKKIFPSDYFVIILIILSTILLIIPEFIYIKDIYPDHYRANTMFKLAYQAFIMLSLSSGYILYRLLTYMRREIRSYKLVIKTLLGTWTMVLLLMLFLISIYPNYATNSYFGDLKNYRGLNGTSYLKKLYPTDYEAILWLNKNISGQPIILEAQGDSYTDYARVSANTGLPTILGWTVHEWLWRGTYDIPAPRIEEIKTLYETSDEETATKLINKYHVSLVFIGNLEHQKYPNLNADKFKNLGSLIYRNGTTEIYRINF